MGFVANDDGSIGYEGNKVFSSVNDVNNLDDGVDDVKKRARQLNNDKAWSHLANINNLIYNGTVDFFDGIGAKYTLLPLTTRLISSPGAVFGSEKIDYTEDTSPIKLEWFDLDDKTFLSESSQIYLELALVQQGIDQVYSVYNSFRKEEADYTHLSEFHHIEYEGQVDQNRNEEIIKGLIDNIINSVLNEGKEDLSHFLSDDDINSLANIRDNSVKKLSFKEVLDLLWEETGDDKYSEFTMEYFDDWEEIKISNMFGDRLVCIKDYPLLEVPFYHAEHPDKEGVAKNADFLWPGYKETVGSGERVASIEDVKNKAEVFNLPREDYEDYIRARKFDDYKRTSGFGVGWERLLQGMLKMPSIVKVAHFPRVHNSLKP